MTSTTYKPLREDEASESRRTGDRAELPAEFLHWQRDSRLALFETLSAKGVGAVKAMPAHLAVMASVGSDGSVNLASKGIGLVPKPELVKGFTELFAQTVRECQGVQWNLTLSRRMRSLLSFYLDLANMDTTKLGGLEIFEGKTYENLGEDPRASLLFTGSSPDFMSYQIDGHVEFVEPQDPYYEFIRSSRELFGKDGFHVHQTAYPHGFVYHVKRVVDKRPFSRTGAHV